MGKIINLSAVLEKEEKLQQVVDYMEELKDQFSDLIQEYEDDGADVRKVDTLTEALDAWKMHMRWSVKLLRKRSDNLFKIRYIQLKHTKQHNVLIRY